MGFLRRLFGSKKVTVDNSDSLNNQKKKKKKTKAKKWGFASSDHNDDARSYETPSHSNAFSEYFDPSKHAIAVAAATAAVAEAALAAAHAAAEVVRLTNGGATQVTRNWRRVEEIAAIRIQSAFRGYLARRALRALKALVKLQSLVRGHIVRKQTADMLRRMQTLVRVQARVRANRSNPSESMRPPSKSSHFHQHVQSKSSRNEYRLQGRNRKGEGFSTLERCGSNSVIDADKSQVGSSWLDSWMEENARNNRRDVSLVNLHSQDEKTDKILEVDTWKPRYKSGQVNRSFKTSRLGLNFDHKDTSFMTVDSPSKYKTRNTYPISSLSSAEVQSLSSVKCENGKDEEANSPQVHSISSKPGSSSRSQKGLFTPSKSECSWGFFSGHPNYMANTESSRAKVRSQSAPRQRLEFDKFVDHNWDTQSYSNFQFPRELNSVNTYSSIGRLNRVGSATKLR